MTLNISQRIPKEFGATRSHLERDIGRQLTIKMKPTAGGGWKGEFEERISGLFLQPVVTKGTIALLYENRDGMTPITPGGAFQAVAVASDSMTRSIPGWSGGDCVAMVQSDAGCGAVSWSAATPANRASCLRDVLYKKHVMPLYEAINGSSPVPYAQLGQECAEELSATDLSGVSAQAWILPLIECGVQLAAQSDVGKDSNLGLALNNLVDGAINPPMLVALERIISALDASIGSQATIQLEHSNYDKAAAALNRAVTWVYQPMVLEALRKLPPATAAGSSTETAAPYTM